MVQLRLFSPVSDWTPPAVSSLPSWPRDGRVAIDTETRDPQLKELGPGVRRDGYIVGVSFAFDRPGGSTFSAYLPIRHDGGGNLDPALVFAYLRDQAALFRGDLVGANMPYDLDYLLQWGVEFRPRRFLDVQVAEPLLDELQFSYSLQAIAERNGLDGKDEGMLDRAAAHFFPQEAGRKGWNSKKHIWRLPPRHVGPYAQQDAAAPLRILEAQERRFKASDAADERVSSGRAPSLWSLWDLECRLLPALVAMRRRGVRVDLDHLDVVQARCVREEEDTCAAFSAKVGRNVEPSDLTKEKIIGPLLEQATGLKFGRTETGKIELKAPKLRALAHPTVDLYLRARRFQKLRTTYVGQLRNHAIGDRVHCTFNQVKRAKDDGNDEDDGAISGRLSAKDPSLQNQPIRDPVIGAIWRQTYLADLDAEWACLDFSAQEPRWMIHFAAESRCIGADVLRSAFIADPSVNLYRRLMAQIGWEGDEAYNQTKIIYLGRAYNMGGTKLCRQLGLATEWITTKKGRYVEVAGDEGQKILETFNRGAPFINELNERTEAVAKKRGFVRTVLGRICRFPKMSNGAPGYDWTHIATNRIVQGSSADQTKMAMVIAHEAGIPLQLQVHDELDLSVGDRKVAAQLAEIMLTAVPCSVPHRVVLEFGPSWGQLE